MPEWITHLYLNKFIIPRYRRNSQIFGNMLSYSYMGEPVGFHKFQNNNDKYARILIKHNIRPWDYEEMSKVGWGHALPELRQFQSETEKNEWIKNNLNDILATKENQKNKFCI